MLKTTILFFSLLICSSAYGDDSIRVYVQLPTVVKINLEQPMLKVGVTYPGKISGLCGLELRSNALKITEFYDAVEFIDRLGGDVGATLTHGERVISIDFAEAEGLFGLWFDIKTKDGSHLGAVIKRTLGKDAEVILLGTTCQSVR